MVPNCVGKAQAPSDARYDLNAAGMYSPPPNKPRVCTLFVCARETEEGDVVLCGCVCARAGTRYGVSLWKAATAAVQ